MKHRILASLLCGLSVTILAFGIGFSSKSLRSLAEILLAPGYFLPEAYWGGAHDPIQIGLAVALNIFFYGIGFYLIFRLRRG